MFLGLQALLWSFVVGHQQEVPIMVGSWLLLFVGCWQLLLLVRVWLLAASPCWWWWAAWLPLPCRLSLLVGCLVGGLAPILLVAWTRSLSAWLLHHPCWLGSFIIGGSFIGSFIIGGLAGLLHRWWIGSHRRLIGLAPCHRWRLCSLSSLVAWLPVVVGGSAPSSLAGGLAPYHWRLSAFCWQWRNKSNKNNN